MTTLTLNATVDEHRRLRAKVPDSVPPGTVQVTLSLPEPADDDDGWSAGVAAIWARDWSDPREDIYDETDGEPIDAPR